MFSIHVPHSFFIIWVMCANYLELDLGSPNVMCVVISSVHIVNSMQTNNFIVKVKLYPFYIQICILPISLEATKRGMTIFDNNP